MSTTEDRGEAKVYELGYLILPSIAEDKLPESVSKIHEVITKNGGNLLDGEEPFRQDLAYSMSKTVGASKYVVNDAYIGWQKFEAEAGQIEAIKAGIEKLDEILRFLLIKAPRETTFTFAKAREVQRQKEEALNQPEAVEEASVEASEAPVDLVVE